MDPGTVNTEHTVNLKMLQRLRNLLKNNMFIALLLIIAILIIGGFVTPSFVTPTNIGSILSMAVLLGFAAAGQTIVVISGDEGIDLSIGAVMSFSAVLSAEIMLGNDGRIILALLIIVIIGALVGIVNALGIIYTRIPPIVMTLAMANVVTSVQLIYTGGMPTGQPAQLLIAIGSQRLLPVLPWLVIVAIGAVIIIYGLLSRTAFGYRLFAMGSNTHAAYLSGVKTKAIKALAYMFSGILSAIAGFWLIGYNGFAFPDMGVNYVLPSVAAVVIGGTSLSGGKGSYLGTMLGAVVLTALGSLLVVLKTDAAGRQIINGIVLIMLLIAYTRQPSLRQ